MHFQSPSSHKSALLSILSSLLEVDSETIRLGSILNYLAQASALVDDDQKALVFAA